MTTLIWDSSLKTPYGRSLESRRKTDWHHSSNAWGSWGTHSQVLMKRHSRSYWEESSRCTERSLSLSTRRKLICPWTDFWTTKLSSRIFISSSTYSSCESRPILSNRRASSWPQSCWRRLNRRNLRFLSFSRPRSRTPLNQFLHDWCQMFDNLRSPRTRKWKKPVQSNLHPWNEECQRSMMRSRVRTEMWVQRPN